VIVARGRADEAIVAHDATLKASQSDGQGKSGTTSQANSRLLTKVFPLLGRRREPLLDYVGLRRLLKQKRLVKDVIPLPAWQTIGPNSDFELLTFASSVRTVLDSAATGVRPR
jgi:hypothetical protein